ncbi:MAG: crossover junction endodeoxyribonuclease RuvC [bacterium]|nr:crossover junction endodeoxyribonuclease RuvC [bacterium]
MKVSLGIDPDLHDTGLALCASDRVLAVGVVRVARKLTGDAAVLRMSKALAEYIPPWMAQLQGHEGFNPAALDALVVEGQELYLVKTGNPDSILRLAQVAGAALSVAQAVGDPTTALIPRPKTWKGTVPKDIHQARMLTRYGWKYKKKGTGKNQWCCPVSLGPHRILSTVKWPEGCWKHIVDAIGLGRWGLQKIGEIEK